MLKYSKYVEYFILQFIIHKKSKKADVRKTKFPQCQSKLI